MTPKGIDEINSNRILKCQQQEINPNYPQCFSKQKLRIGLLVPLSFASQILFCVAAIEDFVGYSSAAGLIILTKLSPLEEFPIRAVAFSLFLSVLLLDSAFAMEAILRGGLSKLKVLFPLILHHLGFGAWAFQILVGIQPYCSGNSYVVFLLEFCFSLRLLLGWFYPSTTSSSKAKLVWQSRIFALDMFLSGGGAFTTAFLYGIVIVDPNLSASERKSTLIVYGMAIIYWFLQLFLVHLTSLNRLLKNLARNPENHDSTEIIEVSNVTKYIGEQGECTAI